MVFVTHLLPKTFCFTGNIDFQIIKLIGSIPNTNRNKKKYYICPTLTPFYFRRKHKAHKVAPYLLGCYFLYYICFTYWFIKEPLRFECLCVYRGAFENRRGFLFFCYFIR